MCLFWRGLGLVRIHTDLRARLEGLGNGYRRTQTHKEKRVSPQWVRDQEASADCQVCCSPALQVWVLSLNFGIKKSHIWIPVLSIKGYVSFIK